VPRGVPRGGDASRFHGRVEVAKVVDRWLAPDHRYFKVTGSDGHTYILRYDPERGWWELTMFEA
jgi:hypothetical protein